MATRTKTRQVIGLWLDATGGEASWIVSRDRLLVGGPDEGGAETTHTVNVFDADDHEAAREQALKLGREEGLPVVHTCGDGTQEDIYTPGEAE